MIQVEGLSDRINADQPTMHVTQVDQPRPQTGPAEPMLSADAAVQVGASPEPGCVETP